MNQSHVRDRQMALRKSFCWFKIQISEFAVLSIYICSSKGIAQGNRILMSSQFARFVHARIAQPCQVLALAHDVNFVEEGPQLNGSITLTSRISAAYLDLDICAWNLRLCLPEQKLCWLSMTPMS